jgi:hypothetical protein
MNYTMKNATQFIIAFALFLSNTTNLEAGSLNITHRLLSSIFVGTMVASTNKSWKDAQAAKRLMTRIDAKINELTKESSKIQAKLDEPNAQLSDKQKAKLAVTLKDLESRLAELNASKADIDRLGNDPNHIYAFSAKGENCVIKINDNQILIQGTNDALLIHEIRHISLWLQTGRCLKFSKNNLLLPIFAEGSVDELQSYRAQYAFAPNSLPGVYPTDMAHVNLEFVAKIQREDGAIAYPSIHQMWEADLKISAQQAKLKQATQGVYVVNDAH